MATNKVRAISVGIGAMGTQGLQYMLDHGIDVVAAVDAFKSGYDLSESIKGLKPGELVAESDLPGVLKRERPDIAFVATQSELPNIFPICMECIEAGTNVITIAEEAFYPWFIETDRGKALDEACKEHGVTMYACGIQDIFGSAIPMALAASCNKVHRFHGYNFQPLEDMGPVVAEGFYVGRSVDEANAKLEEIPDVGNPETRVFLLAIHANCQILGIHPTVTHMTVEALPAPFDVECPQWDMTVKKGEVIGLRCDCHVETEEGITWDHVIDFAVTTDPKKEPPITEWYIDGDPDMHIRTDNMTGEVTTTATVVNRIPDVIAAKPGYLTVAEMPRATYKVFSAEHYLQR